MRVKVEFEIDLPIQEKDFGSVDEWLEFELGHRGSLGADNALRDTDLMSVGAEYIYVRSI